MRREQPAYSCVWSVTLCHNIYPVSHLLQNSVEANTISEKAMAVRLSRPLLLSSITFHTRRKSLHSCKSSVGNPLPRSIETQKLVLEIKEKLEREYPSLPVGRNGRDDEDMIFWFLKDRKFQVEDAISKLTKAIKWRQEFGVSELSEESVKSAAETGKAYLHDFLDVNGRPVLVVVASKHFPADPIESEKLCVFLIEKALRGLPSGKEEILGIFDLRGFTVENGDILFLKFLIDVFYTYYPKRLGQVLFVDAPAVFKPMWQLVKPLLRSYASLVARRGDARCLNLLHWKHLMLLELLSF